AGLLPVTARVRGEWSNSVDRMLLVPAVPGRTTQLGLFDFVPPGFGSVEFDVLYHGEPVPTGWTYQTRIGGLFPRSAVGDNPYTVTTAAGVHDVTVYNCTGCASLSQPVTLLPGETTALSFHLEGVMGRLRGNFTLNGALTRDLIVVFNNESFRAEKPIDWLFRPGDHQARVEYDQVTIGKFDFSIGLGQTTDLGDLDFAYVGKAKLSASELWDGDPTTG